MIYSSRAVPFGRRKYMAVVGTSGYVELLFRHPEIHELAMSMLRQQQRYQRWPWWRIEPPQRLYELRFIDVGARDVALGWLCALWAAWKALR